jgi:hypothetical protein
MRQKIDIADVEAATKIRAKYLRALENEEFGLLPGNTFVKTFLRTYAEYLGLDPQLLLEEYRAGYEPRADNDVQQYSVASSRPDRNGGRRAPRRAPGPPGPGTAVIVIVAVVLLIFAILGLTSGSGGGGSSKQSAKQPAKAHKRKHRRAKPRVTAIRLRVVPVAATYLCVDRGAGTPTVYQGTTASPLAFRGRRVRVNAGNDSIKLSANGKRIRFPAVGQALGYDFRLSAGRVLAKPIPLGQRPCG